MGYFQTLTLLVPSLPIRSLWSLLSIPPTPLNAPPPPGTSTGDCARLMDCLSAVFIIRLSRNRTNYFEHFAYERVYYLKVVNHCSETIIRSCWIDTEKWVYLQFFLKRMGIICILTVVSLKAGKSVKKNYPYTLQKRVSGDKIFNSPITKQVVTPLASLYLGKN